MSREMSTLSEGRPRIRTTVLRIGLQNDGAGLEIQGFYGRMAGFLKVPS